jgi:hypothetical protein
VKAEEGILGREWRELVLRHGDWGRDGLLAVATRHPAWRLGEVWPEGAGSWLRRGGARHPQVLEAGTEQPGDAGFVTALLD